MVVEMLNMANRQMGTPCFERKDSFTSSYMGKPYTSCGFLNCWRPVMGASLNMNRGRTFGSRVQALSEVDSGSMLMGGGTIEKEFEFKPSFKDCLKAMESVKTGREKKHGVGLNNQNLEHDPRENHVTTLSRDERSVKLSRLRGLIGKEKMHRGIKKVNEGQNGGGAVGGQDAVDGKLNYKEKGINKSNVKVGGKESGADANVKWKLEGLARDARRSNSKTTSIKSKLENSNVDESKSSPNAAVPILLDDVISRGSSFGREKFYNCKDAPKICAGKEKAFETEKSGFKGYQMTGKHVTNHIHADKSVNNEYVYKKRLSRGNTQAFLKSGNDDGLEPERAAFKSFEGSDQVIGKPRVAKREMEERIQKLANWLNGADIDMPEWMFSKSMRSAKIRYTDHSILRIVQILGKLGNWRRVLQVIEWLQMRERYKSNRLRNVYTTALNVLGKARRPVEALNVFRIMQQQMSTYPDIVAYHCIAVTLGQAGHMKELFDVIDSMRSPPKKMHKSRTLEKWDTTLEPDIVVYHAVLNACVQRKQWEGAFWVLQQLKQQGQQPSTSTYGLIMEVMLACGKYNLVHEFFRKVHKSSVNALVYRVLVNTLWREGKTDEAVLAVQNMERRGIVGSAALYYDLARCLCSAGRCQEALLQIEKICKVANKPLVVTYTGLIQACLDSGNIQNAVHVFCQMKRFCSPNLVTCNIMLKAYIDHGLFEEASELFYNMLEDGDKICSKSDYRVRVIPDIYTFNTMLDACVAERRWDDFEYAYRRMLHHGYHFNAKRHLRMILDASRAGKEDLLEITWEHLSLADRVIPSSLIKERFCLMLERDETDAALACIIPNMMGPVQAYSNTAWLNLFRENGQRFRKDTLLRLMDEVSMLSAESNSLNPILESLSASCEAFLRTQLKGLGSNMKDIVYPLQSETTLSS